MQSRHRRSVGWEIVRWWIYAVVLVPLVLPILLLAGGHVTGTFLIWAVAIMVVLALLRGRSRQR